MQIYLQSRDGFSGSWKLGGITLSVNDEVVYERDGSEQWLEDDHRSWTAPDFVPDARLGEQVGAWVKLSDDDPRWIDEGDTDPDDRRDAASIASTLGAPLVRTTRGGNRFRGRLGFGGGDVA